MMAGWLPKLGPAEDKPTSRKPQVARVWLVVISHPAAMYSRCCGSESNL